MEFNKQRSNCAIKPIAEQALRPNQTIAPQRLIAALGFTGGYVLHPTQFAVNEAWIAFRLHRKPIFTEDGEICCVGLMDAASGYVLGVMPTKQ
jgi:hypothetical protein